MSNKFSLQKHISQALNQLQNANIRQRLPAARTETAYGPPLAVRGLPMLYRPFVARTQSNPNHPLLRSSTIIPTACFIVHFLSFLMRGEGRKGDLSESVLMPVHPSCAPVKGGHVVVDFCGVLSTML